MNEEPFTALLSKIVDNRGRTAPTASSGIPLIATNCIKDYALYPVFEKVRFIDDDTYRTWFRGHPEPGEILFVCKGTPGRVALVPDPINFCIAQDMVSVRADPTKVYPRYLFAALRSRIVRDRIDNMHVGTLIPHFKKGDFDKLLIPLPDKEIQQTVGDLYFEFSDKIESNSRAITLLEDLGAALLQQELTLDAFGHPEYRPDVQLGDFLSVLETGSRPKGGASNDGSGFVSLGAESIQSAGVMVTANFKTVPLEYAGSMRRGRLIDEDVLVYKDGGKPGHFIPHISAFGSGFPFEAAVINEHVYRARAKDGVSQALLYFLLRSSWMDQEMRKRGTGVAILGLNSSNFRGLPMPMMDSETVERLNYGLGPMLIALLRYGAESKRLAGLRDTLVPKLISGNISAATLLAEVAV
jgi:type I restriction enzyme S subunit